MTAWAPERWLLAAALLAGAGPAAAQETTAPDVLVVVAHPDDEAMLAGSIYRIARGLGGNVDLAVVTDGSAGYRYAYLAEPIYGLELTDERLARHHLAAVRKRELMAGGAIVGLRSYFFLEQPDGGYTEDVDAVLGELWDTDRVLSRLEWIIRRGGYDFVLVHLPIPRFHAHHVAASLLALRAVAELPPEARPVVLGSFVGGSDAPPEAELSSYKGLAGYPITRVRTDLPPFVFDRTQPIREDGPLNYQIVVNWLIAEHKTQGKLQLLMNVGSTERFWYFEANGDGGVEKARRLFDAMKGGGWR